MVTVSDFLTRLPQFEGVNADTIAVWLDTASRTVDSDFGTDQDDAQTYLAAHLMSIIGIGPEKGAAGLAPLSSFRSGAVSMTKDSNDKRGDFALTSFGRLFWDMWRAAKGGPVVLDTGDYPWPYGGERPYAY